MDTHVDYADFWDKRYSENSANWDLKSPTPVFINLIKEGIFLNKGKILIPGCGKGYDAVYAAQKGFDVTGIDFSEKALEYARNLSSEKGVKVNFVNEDIFQAKLNESFDYIFEYVTFCAINPARRREFAEKLAGFLKPGGKLIALLFPVDGRTGGPPFNIDIIEAFRTFSEFLKLEFASKKIESVKPRTGREVLHIYQKIY